MSCKDCIHKKVCGKQITKRSIEPKGFELTCKDYINKSDVVEVKHWEWIPYYKEVEVYNSGGFTEKKRTGWICGKCKRKRSFTPYGTEKYCCECGAKNGRKE